MEIDKDKIVQIHYKGTLKDDSVFDSSEGRDPLTFMYGSGMIIPGLEEGLKGLKKGDKKKIEVASENAYGPVSNEAIQEVPKDQLPTEVELKPGLQLMAQTPHGPMPVKVVEVADTTVKMDFNHPLAGQDLVFDVEVVEVREATPEEAQHGHAHGPGSAHNHDEESSPEEPEESKDSKKE